MNQIKNYIIYNASAGAGKTFTLVIQFLKIILKNPNDHKIKNILAITFTNKAANEMKQRILLSLIELASNKESKYKQKLEQELNFKPERIQENAQKCLEFILHNYSYFSVSTIDKFNFRLLRSFSKELNLPSRFSIEINDSYYLEQAINEISTLIGTEDINGKLLLDYVMYEFNENEKRINFRKDLKNRIKEFNSEKNYFSTSLLKNKTLDDFSVLKKNLIQRIQINKNQILKLINSSLSLIQKNNLSVSDFSGGKVNGILTIFEKLKNLFEGNLYKEKISPAINNIYKTIETGIYAPKTSKNKETVESIYPKLIENFHEIYQIYQELIIDLKITSELVNVETHTKVNDILNVIKKEQDIVFISDANQIINLNLAQEPSNYLYEKIGSKYKHYFFDEFQDTSEIQWDNFLPLVENTINQNEESVMLVGDVKQSIYRFKGGKPELLLNEIKRINNELSHLGEVYNLPDNWRSTKNIVDFNNIIYSSYSSLFQEKEYQEVYKNAVQTAQGKNGGKVQVAYFNKDLDYLQKSNEYILETIKNCVEQGFDYSDIVILFRKNKHAKEVASFLIENNIPILSEDALFLDSILCIDCILSFLRWKENPENISTLFNALYSLNLEKKIFEKISFSDWFYSIKKYNQIEILDEINSIFNLELTLNNNDYLSSYDLIEDLIRSLDFTSDYQIYFSTFLNVIYQFESQGAKTIHEFLIYWENEGEKIKYKLAEKDNSVQLMTIHKSKGLEFPVVIYPFDLSQNTSKEHNWYSLNPDKYSDFETFYFKIKKEEIPFLPTYKNEFLAYELEKNIDDLNVNYVATTRAEKQLYLVFPIQLKNKDTEREEKRRQSLAYKIETLFNLSIDENTEELITNLYDDQIKEQKKEIKNTQIKQQFNWASNPWKTMLYIVYKNDFLSSEDLNSRVYGNLIHDLLAKITTKNKLESIFKKAILQGIIPKDLQKNIYDSLKKVIFHKDLEMYFEENLEILNERDFLFEGKLLRADKIVKINNEYIILDYKTGKFQESYVHQINEYENALIHFGKKVSAKIIILINKEIEIKRV